MTDAAGMAFWLAATLLAYGIGLAVHARLGNAPVANPVLIAMLLLAPLLWALAIPYAEYFARVEVLHVLLGTATVGLAVPLARQLDTLRRFPVQILVAVAAGSIVAVISAVGVAWALGASAETLLSLAPKSVTTPIAIGIAEEIGGLPSLTAVLVIVTGVIGAVMGRAALNLARVRDWRARGLAVGTAAHGIGTARAFQVNETAGAFSGLAMGVNGLLTALVLPALLRLLG